MDGAADALRWERTSRGLNPDEAAAVLRSIARRLGVRADDIDGDSVLRWEMGGPLPTRVLRLISAAFDVPFLDLAGLTDHGYQAHWLEFSPGGVRVLREERNGMLRRDFLRYIGGLAVGGLADHERMAYALANIGRLDGRLVGDLEHLTAEYGDRMWTTAPARLLPVLRGHLTVLRQLMTGAAGQPWAGVLQLAGGTTSVVIGRLEWASENHAEANGHFDLAARLAMQVGDAGLLAHARGMQRWRFSPIQRGREPDSRAAIALLDSAIESAPFENAYLLAWLLTARGHEHAAAGHAYESDSDLDSAYRALSRAEGAGRGYFAPWTGSTLEIDSIRGAAATMLGRAAEAVVILDFGLSSPDDIHPGKHSAMLADLAEAHLCGPAPEVEHAAGLLAESLTVAYRAGLPEKVQKVVGIRSRRLNDYVDEPVVRALDEQIIASR